MKHPTYQKFRELNVTQNKVKKKSLQQNKPIDYYEQRYKLNGKLIE